MTVDGQVPLRRPDQKNWKDQQAGQRVPLTVTKHSSSLRQRLLRLSEPSPHRRLSSLSIRSWPKRRQHAWQHEGGRNICHDCSHLHPLLGFVEPHQHVDDVKTRCRLVLLVNPPKECTESLREEAEKGTRLLRYSTTTEKLLLTQ